MASGQSPDRLVKASDILSEAFVFDGELNPGRDAGTERTTDIINRALHTEELIGLHPGPWDNLGKGAIGHTTQGPGLAFSNGPLLI